MLSVDFSTFLSYILLSNERPGSVVDISYPFEGSLPSTIVVLSNEQRMTMVFTREFMAGLIEYAGRSGRADLKVSYGGFPIKMT